MKIDLYTKVVLTVIAVALWGIFLAPFFEAREVGASTGIMDVNIKQIDGRRVKSVLDVNIAEVSGRKFFEGVPVDVKQ
jgi:hypothetical protein